MTIQDLIAFLVALPEEDKQQPLYLSIGNEITYPASALLARQSSVIFPPPSEYGSREQIILIALPNKGTQA